MCAIAGYTFHDDALIRNMCEVVSHRGPDGEGYYSDDYVTLGHRRLAIIDLETGQQPIYNEDQSIVLVCNGEIYNFRQLRISLEQKGHRFSTKTDVEVIIHLYEDLGIEKFLHELEGMFGFALWDSNKKTLVLARDRVGLKPLHYAMTPHGVVFASEIKSILASGLIEPVMNPHGLHCTINLRYIPGCKTMFQKIYRVLPGHALVFEEGWNYESWWWNPPQRFNGPMDDQVVIDFTRKTLEQSVLRHMVADVPVGVLLSGGIDSSSIVAFASQLLLEPIKTFTLGFGNENDEIGDANLIARCFHTDHYYQIIPDTLLQDYPEMIWYADEPKRNLYPFYIARLAKQQGVKVILSGIGADELYGGYQFKYQYADIVKQHHTKHIFLPGEDGMRVQAHVTKAANHLIKHQLICDDRDGDDHLKYLNLIKNLNDPASLYMTIQSQDYVFDNDYLSSYVYNENLPATDLKPHYEFHLGKMGFTGSSILHIDFMEKLPNDFLLVDDRMTSAHGLESRAPFLDFPLVNAALKTPTSIVLKDPAGKHILKQAMKDILPKSVIKKKKQGFAPGIFEPFVREGKELIESLVVSGRLVEDRYLQNQYIEKIITHPPSPSLNIHYSALWNMLVSEIWYRMFIDGVPWKKVYG